MAAATSTYERLLVALALLLVSMLVCELYGVAVVRESTAFRENPAMPHAADLLAALPIALALVAARVVLERVFMDLARVVLAPAKQTPYRIERFAIVLFKFVYFTTIAITGFGIIRHEKWFPRSLGGRGDVIESFRVLDEPPTPSLKLYLFVQFAYQLHNVVYILVLTPFRGDTLEFAVHDLITMFLIATAYVTNYVALAVSIGYLNDLCDIAHLGFKVVQNTGFKLLIAIVYAAHIVMWAYTRLYVYPTEFLYSTFVLLPKEIPGLSLVFLQPMFAALGAIQFLQLYWFVLYVRMAPGILWSASGAQKSGSEASRKAV